MNSSFLPRTRIVLSLVGLFGLVLILKLFYVQIVHNSFYSEKAEHQYATPSGDIFERGNIYFSRKDGGLVSAATQMSGYKVAINPTKITDIDGTYQKLSNIIPTLDPNEFHFRASKANDPYEEIANHLSKDSADAISALKIPGVSIFKEKWRFYPGSNLASHALGIVAFKEDELAGRYGLEREYNTELSRSENNPYVNFFAEVFSNVNQTFFENEGREGDIVTTIESEVQGFLEKKLAEVRSRYSVDSIGGIIMNPMDGSIVAMSSQPDFDPNNLAKVTDPSVLSNPIVENVLEFGSVVKPLVMAAALNEHVVTAKTTYHDSGSVIVEDKEIFNFDRKGRGNNVTMQEVLNQSLNTGMVFVEKKLGRNNLKNYLLSYGLKDKSGIDLPNESSGLVSNLNSPRELEFANAAFGQGIAMTPISMIRALASLGNGGKLVVPHLASKIKYQDGTYKTLEYPVTDTKISKATSEEITRMLVGVMDQSLKGGQAKFEHFSVAVKTGTAQVANNTSGGYYEDRHTHSFFGYFPAYDPKFIVFLYAVNPKGVAYAANTWADPFLDITKFLLNYYEVAPDR